MSPFNKARFAMDALGDAVFEGYSDGSEWNGWACPYFEREVAEKVLAASSNNGYDWQYDVTTDAFIVKNREDDPTWDPEVFEAMIINVDGVSIKVYPVGAYSWIWEIFEETP